MPKRRSQPDCCCAGCDGGRGVFWGAWLKREPQAQRALMTDIVKWCAEGKLSAHVHAVYPLAETATALKAISDRKVMRGKSCCGRDHTSPRSRANRAGGRAASR